MSYEFRQTGRRSRLQGWWLMPRTEDLNLTVPFGKMQGG
jgi:hypothetical protein